MPDAFAVQCRRQVLGWLEGSRVGSLGRPPAILVEDAEHPFIERQSGNYCKFQAPVFMMQGDRT